MSIKAKLQQQLLCALLTGGIGLDKCVVILTAFLVGLRHCSRLLSGMSEVASLCLLMKIYQQTDKHEIIIVLTFMGVE
jgi:hypothetical protein